MLACISLGAGAYLLRLGIDMIKLIIHETRRIIKDARQKKKATSQRASHKRSV